MNIFDLVFAVVPKVWNLTNCKLKTNHVGHQGYLNAVTVSPDGSLCASGGKDTKAMLWDLNEDRKLYTLDNNDIINALCFSPNRYWLCVANGPAIRIWVSSLPPQPVLSFSERGSVLVKTPVHDTEQVKSLTSHH